ncbi:hypothetical protein ALO71_02947 [Pseudomonas amygdali pv. dendropanacis]|uniref:Amidase n=1 Tax=Pseudomonas amygdali pv. dendropanacis TaxID=235272 RepID=A0A0P9PS55_PSEA0|nr:hypothetical protein ALO71_02947 [Pseudomonas amygdali pv. dendropanacis]
MAIERPSAEQLQVLASRLHMHLTTEQAREYLVLMQGSFDAYDLIDDAPDEVPRTPITPGTRKPKWPARGKEN